jgi:CelD/BcsL family acetyltransferase involved in cellulose biosynthesis
MDIRVYDPRTDRDRIREIWTELFRSDLHTYFLSWAWIETWLDVIPSKTALAFYAGFDAGKPCIAFFLGGPYWRYRHLVPWRTISLNATGDSYFDRLNIEYNCMMHDPDRMPSLSDVLGSIPMSWDRFILPELDSRLFPAGSLTDVEQHYRVRVVREERSHFVDLSIIRSSGKEYLAHLNGNARYQLRKARRLYEALGPLTVCEPANLRQAMQFYDELSTLSRRTWAERNETSAFESDFFRRFHRALILRRFRHGEIQLLKVSCGEATVGLLYNFVIDGRVYFYQSGLRYQANGAFKPGLVTHREAIEYNLLRGGRLYDFLGGEAQYKRSLSTHFNLVRTVRIQRRAGVFGRLEKAARMLSDTLRSGLQGRGRGKPWMRSEGFRLGSDPGGSHGQTGWVAWRDLVEDRSALSTE